MQRGLDVFSWCCIRWLLLLPFTASWLVHVYCWWLIVAVVVLYYWLLLSIIAGCCCRLSLVVVVFAVAVLAAVVMPIDEKSGFGLTPAVWLSNRLVVVSKCVPFDVWLLCRFCLSRISIFLLLHAPFFYQQANKSTPVFEITFAIKCTPWFDRRRWRLSRRVRVFNSIYYLSHYIIIHF